MEGFADMLNLSQLGDRVADVDDPPHRRIKHLDDDSLTAVAQESLPIRRLAGDYHVSTPNIDRLVAICLRTPGVLAARLSGAGLGGMVIVLGQSGFPDTLDPVLRRDYYDPLGRDLHKIPIVPSEGAGGY
jgi:galactokinase